MAQLAAAAWLIGLLAAVYPVLSVLKTKQQSRTYPPRVILVLVCQLLWVAGSPYQQQNLIWTNRVNLQLPGY